MSFKSLITATSEQYQEIRRALTLFPYFETWDENVIDECCRLSSIREYAEDSIILGSCGENAYTTFFILEGTCKIIHRLRVRVKVNSYGKTIYKLYQPTNSKSSNSEFPKIEYTSMLFNEMHKFQEDSAAEKEEEEEGVENEILTEKKTLTDEKVEEKQNFVEEENEGTENFIEQKNEEEEENPVLISAAEEHEAEAHGKEDDCMDQNNELGNTEQEFRTILRQDTEKNLEVKEANQNKDDDSDKVHETETEIETKSESMETNLEERRQVSLKEEESKRKMDSTISLEESKNVKEEVQQEESEITYDEDHHLKILEECKAKAKQNMRSMGHRWTTDKPKDVKSFFVQVGLFYKGSCFGLEEHLKDTVVMSATKVKCLRIPRRFLFQHNPCNIWNRIRLFFSLHLPTEEQILEYFSSNRAWLKKKESMSKQISSLKKIPNYTLCSDIPYGIRLLQEL